MESPIAFWNFRRGVVRLSNTKESVEEGAEDGEGDENEAEGLFGAMDDLSVVKDARSDQGLKDKPGPFDDNYFVPCQSYQLGVQKWAWGSRRRLQVKSLDQNAFSVIAFATAHIAVLPIT